MTTLTAFLDLAVCPVSYDAVVFMAQADMERRRIGATRMHVVVVGEMRSKPQYDDHEARWRLWNIVVPAVSLFGATVTLSQDWLQAERLAAFKEWKNWPHDWHVQTLKDRRHLIGGVIARAKDGEVVPRLQASEHARRKVRQFFGGRRVVTMTMRDTYLPERNSDPLIWRAAQEEIRDRGFEVETLGDTDKALALGRGYGELNLDIRMAMYQEAVFNIQANNGSASLCWFSDRPYVMMGAGVPEEEWDGLFVKQGLPLGESWPWAVPHQRIAYGPTSADQIVEEFDLWASATR